MFCSPFHGITDIEELKFIFSIEHFSLDEVLRKYLVVSSENFLSQFPGHFVHIRNGVLTENM